MQLTIEIAEREKFTLYKAMAIPIHTANGRLIVSTLHNYFLLNEDQNKFIPLDEQELNNGISLAPNEFLYRTASGIFLSHEAVCVRNLFVNDELIM